MDTPVGYLDMFPENYIRVLAFLQSMDADVLEDEHEGNSSTYRIWFFEYPTFFITLAWLTTSDIAFDAALIQS